MEFRIIQQRYATIDKNLRSHKQQNAHSFAKTFYENLKSNCMVSS